ncbi:hypothetical protein L7F22_002052 [Adiantum nelumboides]|nr:hypothetical protein [Adiantum nelumboides]
MLMGFSQLQQERGPKRFQGETSKRGLSMEKGVENPYQELKQLLEGKPSSKKKGHAQHERSPSMEREESESSDESMADVAPRRRRAQRSPTPTKQKRSPHSPHRHESKREEKSSRKKKERKRSPSSPSSLPSSSLNEDKVLAFIQQFDAAFGDEGFTDSLKLRHVAMHFQKSARQRWASLWANGEAPKTWKALRASILKQFLASDAKDKVLTEWRSLKLSPYTSIHKYVDKFWDLHLKATVYKKIDFEEQKQQFCAGLSKDMNEYVNSQRPKSISAVVHHTMVAARINFQQGAKRNLKPMEAKDKQEFKGNNFSQNSSKDNSNNNNNKAKQKGEFKGKNKLSPKELASYHEENKCFKFENKGTPIVLVSKEMHAMSHLELLSYGMLGANMGMAGFAQPDAQNQNMAEASKIRKAATFLKTNALQWWITLLNQDVVPLTWVQFKQIFAPAWITNTFEVDVMTAWNQMSANNCESLEEYNAKFWDAFLPVSSFKMVPLAEQIEKYCCGLPKGIKKYCTKTSVMNMAQLMENAEVANDLIQGKPNEDGFKTPRKEPQGKQFSAKGNVTSRLTVPPFKKKPFAGSKPFAGDRPFNTENRPNAENQRFKLPSFSGQRQFKRHFTGKTIEERKALRDAKKCYICEEGHFANKCPQRNSQNKDDKSDRKGKKPKPKPKPSAGLVPDLVGDQQNVDATELCTAWGKVKDQEVLVFFDPGARANFISPELASKLGIRVEEMGMTREAGLACPGHAESVTPILGKLRLHIQSYVDAEEFHIMPLQDCDVLLGLLPPGGIAP